MERWSKTILPPLNLLIALITVTKLVTAILKTIVYQDIVFHSRAIMTFNFQKKFSQKAYTFDK